MWLEIFNSHAKLAQATDQEREWLSNYLSFDDAKARFRRKYGYTGDGKIHMYSRVNDQFPAGFVLLVRRAAEREGMKVEIFDRRDLVNVVADPNPDLSWLRWYQIEAVQAVIAKTRGIIKVPTGGGKTEIAIGLTRAAPSRWLFLVHRGNLLHQTAERYTLRTGLKAGMVGDGIWDPSPHFTVATFQTVVSAFKSTSTAYREAGAKLMNEAYGIIVDEVHTLPAESFWKVAMLAVNAYWRVGLSGTPLDRGDKRSLLAIAAIGPMIYEIKPSILIDEGVLAKPKIRLVPVMHICDKPTWQGVYGECIVRSTKRNRAVIACVKASQKPCLVFVKEIKHGKLLQKELEKANIKTGFVWGSDSIERRKQAIKQLIRGELEALICSVIFQEGVDVPELRSVVVASGGKSVIATLQRIGRGMRVTDDKATFEVWDIDDRGNAMLDRHTRERVRAYGSQGYDVSVESASTLAL